MHQLKRYLIERDIPGVGGMSILELCGAARTSNRAIEQIGTNAIRWNWSMLDCIKRFGYQLSRKNAAFR